MSPVTEQRVLGGRYRLVGRLGGTDVWRARDELLRRDVAVTRLEGTSEEDLAAGFAVTAATLAVVDARPPHFTTPPQACDLLTVEDVRTLITQAEKAVPDGPADRHLMPVSGLAGPSEPGGPGAVNDRYRPSFIYRASRRSARNPHQRSRASRKHFDHK